MSRKREILALLTGDFIAINLAWYAFYWFRVNSGWFLTSYSDITPAHLIPSSLAIYVYWLIWFLFFGLYRSWYVRSPFDEVITLSKTLAVGTLILALVIWWDPSAEYTPQRNDPRLLAVTYFCLVTLLTIVARLTVRMTQAKLLVSGVGRRPVIVVGDTPKAQELTERLMHHPRLGYDVLGFVSPRTTLDSLESFTIIHRNGSTTEREFRRLGSTDDLDAIIEQNDIREVLIALGSGEHEALVEVISKASRSNVGLKIVPDLYDIISGQARTREIYGFPLIDINPVILRPWEEAAKRTLDLIVSAIIIVGGMPVWLVIAAAVKATSRGPAIYSQDRIGRNGRPFKMYKYRSMVVDAEKGGPQWASKNDPRVTSFGRFLRKSHLDEVPQFLNVFRGDMSLVGPRPERGIFVDQLTQQIPYYNRRHRVRPGVTGLCQAMLYKYDENLDDVRNKVKYDLMYIESMSLRLDVKILFWTVYKVLRHRGQA